MLTNSENMPLSKVSKVRFFFEGVNITLRHRTLLKKFIEQLFKTENRQLNHINYIFCSDQKIIQINREFLKHDYYTDIITFEYSEPREPAVSDIYISIDRVRANAVSHGTLITHELKRVIFHGALHLCGYRDKTTREKKEMRGREELYLSKFHSQRST